jgi:hypothetical protein
VIKKLYALLKGLGEVWGALATLGVAATIIAFAKALPTWIMIALAAVTLAVCSGAMTSLYYRRRAIPRFRENVKRWHDMFQIAKQQRDELDAIVNGDAWPADASLKIDLAVLDQADSIFLKGPPDFVRAELDFYVQAYVACPFPVVLRHYTLEISVSGPGVSASGRYDKPTGWGPSSPRSVTDFPVKASIDAKVGVGALQNHAVINVVGNVVVGSDDWGTDRTVFFRLSRRCLVRNELPVAAISTDSVFAVSARPRQI